VARARRIRLPDGSLALAGPPAAPEPHPDAVAYVLAKGEPILRIYDPGLHGASADGFRQHGPHARFDHHRRPAPSPAAANDPERGIMYGAARFRCCVGEFFGDQVVADPDGPRAARLEVVTALRLLDLREDHARQVGTLPAVAQDSARATTQDWGRYWYEHPELAAYDGLVFASAQTNLDAYALWERAQGKVKTVFDAPLRDAAVWPDLLVEAARLRITLLI
jgi:hypothetical protein